MVDINSAIVDAFDGLSGDPSTTISAAKNYSNVDGWVNFQMAQAGAAGATAMLIPGLHLVGLVADMAFLLNKMGVCAWGIGTIYGCNVYGKADLENILAIWSGAIPDTEIHELIAVSVASGMLALAISQQFSVKFAEKLVAKAIANPQTVQMLSTQAVTLVSQYLLNKVGVKVGAKGISKMAMKLGAKAGGKLATDVATKMGIKIGAKITTKGVLGIIPFVGAAAAAGINAYFVNDIASAAKKYYRARRDFEAVILEVVNT